MENEMAKTLKSRLSGVLLMQTIRMSVPVPCRIEYTVRHRGDGNNPLRVRFGNFFHLIWAQIHDFEIEPDRAKSRSTEIGKDNTGSNDARQDVRWRLSRAALTKAIDWELTYTVFRLDDAEETDATSDCHAKVTDGA
jgi:hypothetical protein